MIQIEQKKPRYLKDLESLRDGICDELQHLECIIRSKHYNATIVEQQAKPVATD